MGVDSFSEEKKKSLLKNKVSRIRVETRVCYIVAYACKYEKLIHIVKLAVTLYIRQGSDKCTEDLGTRQ